MDDEKHLSYFSSINSIAGKILKDEIGLKHAVKNQWNELSLKEQEDLIDDFLVDQCVREKYCQIDKTYTYKKSFPKLRVETGEKIIVDFENDCWTWQDEHSSPFNWRTKSQQDLTLDDLEPDVLSKPPVKSKKKEVDEEKPEELAETEFSLDKAGEVWNIPALQSVERPELLDRSRSVSPVKSLSRESVTTGRSKTPEEINKAFTGSVDDLSSHSDPHRTDRSPSVSSGEILSESIRGNESSKRKPARRQRSFSKSPIKSVIAKKSDTDAGSESLVPDKEDNPNAFDNLAMGTKWSAFVNEEDTAGTNSGTPSPRKLLLKEPEPIDIDRDYRPDDPSQSSLLNTHEFGDDFKDEILIVETQPNNDLDASNMSKTGFDFLDNW